MSKKIYRAVFLLTLFSILDRVLGFAFKVYLSRQMSETFLGIYQVALSFFFVLLTLTTSGTPLIVSKLTAKFRAKNDIDTEQKVVAAALVVGVVSAGVISLAVFLLRDFISGFFASKLSMTVLLILLPGVVFSGVYAAFRGSFWGTERYMSVAVIEVIEQIIRIGVCVLMFLIGFEKLKVTAFSMSVACGFTAVACTFVYFKSKGRLKNPKGQIVPLIKQSVPITMIRASNSIIGLLVALAVPYLLRVQGMSVADSLKIYGASVGIALPLLYIPITVVGSLAYVLIPTLSSALTKNDFKSVNKQIENAVSFSIVVAVMFIPAFFALGNPLGMFIYKSQLSGEFLAKSAWLLLPIAVESITSSMMNSLELQRASFINYAIGSAAMFALMFAFYSGFHIEVLIWGLGLSLTISSILDIRKIAKKTGISFSFIMPLIKSIIIALPTVILTHNVYSLVNFMHPALSLLIAGGVSVMFFASLCYVFGVIHLHELFPKKSLISDEEDKIKNLKKSPKTKPIPKRLLKSKNQNIIKS